MPSSTSFQILEGFLRRTSGEVEGRENKSIPADVLRRIRDFASGRLAPEAREELLAELDRHPDWLAALAAEVKSQRKKGGNSKS